MGPPVTSHRYRFEPPGPLRGVDDLAEDSAEKLHSRHGSPVDLYRVARALWSGKLALAGALLAGVLSAVGVAKSMQPTFVANTVLKYEGLPAVPGLPDPGTSAGEVGSLAEALKTDEVLSALKAHLGLDQPVAVLSANIESVVDVPNGVVRVSVKDNVAATAAREANGLAELFIAHLVERERARIEEGLASLRERITHAQSDLAASREAYDAFREEHGISDLDTDLGQSISSAAQFKAQRDMAEAEIGALEARVAQLRHELRRTPRMQVASAATQTPELMEVGRLQTELTTARSNLSDSHPRVQALERQIAALRLRISSGQASVISTATMGSSGQYGALESALSTALADLQARRQSLEDLKQLAGRDAARVDQIAGLEGEATTLLARMHVNQTLVNDLNNIKVRMEDALRDPQSGFSVMAPASVPTGPEPNKREKLAALGVPLFVLGLAALFLLFREFRGMRVCTASELAFWGDGPVIATTLWPRDAQAVDDLIADMDDYAPHALGRTLVIGASREQSMLARTVATRLHDDWNDTVSVTEYDPMSSAPYSTQMSKVGAAGSAPGPYADVPISESMALVPVSSRGVAITRHRYARRDVESWDGPDEGPALRRAARLADRVAVVVPSGALSAVDIAAITTRIGRADGVGFILVDLEPSFSRLKDRVGNVADFWSTRRL
jgi:uncharacterized protein involved in exopolysaccharide biosynthesis